MLRSHFGFLVLDDNHGSADTTSITCNMYRAMVIVDVYADELADLASSSQSTEILHKSRRIARQTNDGAVNHNNIAALVVYLGTSRQTYVYNGSITSPTHMNCGVRRTFNPKSEDNTNNRSLFHVCRDVCHQSKVLHQPACLPFRSVTGTQHAPLARL